MAVFEIKAPRVDANDESVIVVRWRVADGAQVKVGDVLLDVDTDKATVEIAAERAGVVKHRAAVKEKVAVGGVLAVIADSAQELEKTTKAAARKKAAQTDTVLQATDGARELAAEHGIDLSRIGKKGVITRKDVERLVGGGKPGRGAQTRSVKQVIEPDAVHQRMVERITKSHHEIIPAVLFAQWDVAAVVKAQAEFRGQKKLYELADFIVFVAVRALAKFEKVNAAYVDGAIHVFGAVNAGFTMDHKERLFIPVIRNAQDLKFDELAVARRRLAMAVLRGTITGAELRDGTFTVSMLDAPGTLGQIAIVPPEQAAILAVGALQQSAQGAPCVVGGLTYDHRVFSGHYAMQYMQEVGAQLQSPPRS